jgi:hypothetical protein
MVDQVVRRLSPDSSNEDIALAVNRLIDGIGTLSVATAYGQLFSDDAGLAETFTTSYSVIADANNISAGLSRMTTCSPTNGTIAPITEAAGTYLVMLQVSFTSSASGRNIHLAVHKDGVKQDAVSCERYASSVQVGSMSAMGIIEIDDGETIDIRGLVDTGSITATFNHFQFVAIRLGPIM